MYNKNKVKPVFYQAPSTGQQEAMVSLTFNLAYQEYASMWEENYACYKGINWITKANLVGKHPRETDDNWEYRKAKLASPNYTKAIVDAYSAHLARKKGIIYPGSLENNPLFKLFLDDCDFNNTTFLELFREQTPLQSVLGGVGFLVDMPAFDAAQNMSIEMAAKEKIYPYVSVYYPPNILDWQYVRDEWGRPVLVYLKLIDEDGMIRCWWDMGDEIIWEVYQSSISVLTANVGTNSSYNLQNMRVITDKPNKVSEGRTNRIKYIPFEFGYNRKSGIRMIGESDVSDIVRLDVRIIDDLSCISEMANLDAFPILKVPKSRSGDAPAEMPIGPTSVIEYDPQYPESQPEWLASEAAEPIRALWMDIENSREEIYRTSLFGGMDQQNGGNNTGPALNLRYQQLGARLVEKVKFQEQVANGVLYHWQSWMGMEIDEQARVQMPDDYNIEDLAADIDQAIKSSDFISSDAFRREMRRTIAHKMLPNLPIEVQDEIDKEVEDEFQIEEMEEGEEEGVADETQQQDEGTNDSEEK